MKMEKMKMIKTITLLFSLISLIVIQGCSHAPSPKAKVFKHVTQSTALMKAAQKGDDEKVSSLLNSGANPNVASPEGTPLMMAVAGTNAKLILLLLQHGADPNFGTPAGGESAIMIAADKGETRIVKMLLAAGADVNYADSKGDAAVSLATYKGHLTTVKVLIKAGADVNISPGGESLLMRTVSDNDLLLSQVLIAAGADVNFATPEGNTALKIAAKSNYRDIEMLLIQSGANPD
jgi:ankyrin repeat protein